MKILLHDYPGHPFQIQLSRSLAKRGHEIRHLYAGYNKTPRGPLVRQTTDPENFSIFPIFITEPLDKYNFVKRRKQEQEYGKLLAKEIIKFDADVMISSNTPLDSQKAALRASKKAGTPFVFWLQDIIGLAAQRLLRKRLSFVGDLIGRYYIEIEKKLLQQSDHVVAITEDFLPLLINWKVAKEQITVIPNWAPLNDLPVQLRSNLWSKQHNLTDKFCFMYTGTLGMKHDPNALLQLALHFRPNKNVRVIIISEGPGADWLTEQKEIHGLDNLILLGFQPFEQLPDVLGTADVLIALLEPDAGVFSVPSKVLSYLCARRPIMAAIPSENLAARIITEYKAGIVIEPKSLDDFVSEANNLFRDKKKRNQLGENGRMYAEAHFNIDIIGDRFEKILNTFL